MMVSKAKLFVVIMLLGGGGGCSSAAVSPQHDEECRLPNNGALSGDINLNPACTYHGKILIEKSGTRLNCNGAIIDGDGKVAVGIQIGRRGANVQDVIVNGCKVRNFSSRGVLVTSGLKMSDWSQDHSESYDVAPKNIRLKNLDVEGSGSGGVYFDSYVQDSSLEDSIVAGSGKVGVYLEQASRKISIINNVIKENGAGPGSKREGLAIDSSAHNRIEGNKFISNGAGGVFLYKNCGEKISSGASGLRWQHSDENYIAGNIFSEEKVGVWIASRQSKNLAAWDCGDTPLDGSHKFYRDYANHNKVTGNEFCGGVVGVRVEGENNLIEKNKFSVSGVPVEQPYLEKSLLGGRPITTNIVEGSQAVSCD